MVWRWKFFAAFVVAALVAAWAVPAPLSGLTTPAGNRARMLDQTVLVNAAGGAGHGSGVVIGPRTVLTVAHVALMASNFTVAFRNGRTIAASVLWTAWSDGVDGDTSLDLAVLLLAENAPVQPATIACARPASGEALTVVGNPLHERWVEAPVTVGSDTPPAGEDYNMLVIGMLIPGMSGGPAFNAAGQVAGLVTSMQLMPLGKSASITGMGALVSGEAACWAGLGRAA